MRRIQKYLKLDKAKLLYSTFVNSQFSYALVIWSFAGKRVIKRQRKFIIKHLKLFLVVTNFMQSSLHERARCQFIKNISACCLPKFIKLLQITVQNLYIPISYLKAYRMNCAVDSRQYVLPILEQTQYILKYAWLGMGYHLYTKMKISY